MMMVNRPNQRGSALDEHLNCDCARTQQQDSTRDGQHRAHGCWTTQTPYHRSLQRPTSNSSSSRRCQASRLAPRCQSDSSPPLERRCGERESVVRGHGDHSAVRIGALPLHLVDRVLMVIREWEGVRLMTDPVRRALERPSTARSIAMLIDRGQNFLHAGDHVHLGPGVSFLTSSVLTATGLEELMICRSLALERRTLLSTFTICRVLI